MKYQMIKPSGRDEERVLQYGDLLEWTTDSYKGTVVLFCYKGLVELEDPEGFWSYSYREVRDQIKNGSLKYLPKGTKITLEQE